MGSTAARKPRTIGSEPTSRHGANLYEAPHGVAMRTITLEEHFISPGFLAGPGKQFSERLRNSGARGARIYEELQDIGDKRVANMDAAGIDMQVLSLNAPGVEQADVAEQISIAREANDFLAEAVKKHPKRFAGLAILP